MCSRGSQKHHLDCMVLRISCYSSPLLGINNLWKALIDAALYEKAWISSQQCTIQRRRACEERHLLKTFSVSDAKVCSPCRIFFGVRPLAVFLIEYNVSATPSMGPVRRLTLVDEPGEELLVPVPDRGTNLAMGKAASKACHAITTGREAACTAGAFKIFWGLLMVVEITALLKATCVNSTEQS